MSEYIDKDAAREEFNRRGLCGTELFDMFPVADVAPVKHGKWLQITPPESNGIMLYKCSVCGREEKSLFNVKLEYPYCHCGAEMNLT